MCSSNKFGLNLPIASTFYILSFCQFPRRFFFGRTKVMAKALGNSENEEILEGLHKLSENLVGDVGLFFTNESKERVFEFMASFEVLDFARTGCVAPESVVVYADEKGLKHAETEQFLPATAEPQLRGCGLPTMLVGGLIRLTCDSFQICEEGEKLNADKCRLLKMLGFRLAPFKIIPIGYYTEGNYISCSE